MSDADAICGRGCDCKDAPAAAVPEAQDGRQWVSDECQHIDTCRMCEAPDECGCHCHAAIRASAAVREGERERLAAGWDRVLASLLFDSDPESVQQYRAGWEDCAKAVRAHLASLAAPEGTEQ